MVSLKGLNVFWVGFMCFVFSFGFVFCLVFFLMVVGFFFIGGVFLWGFCVSVGVNW